MGFYLTGPQWIASRRKRLFDLTVCAAILPVCTVVMLIALACTIVERVRPPLYSDWRIGRCGKRFKMHKIRTWHPHTPRPTRTGALLAVLGFDEMPQLLYTSGQVEWRWSGRVRSYRQIFGLCGRFWVTRNTSTGTMHIRYVVLVGWGRSVNQAVEISLSLLPICAHATGTTHGMLITLACLLIVPSSFAAWRCGVRRQLIF